MRHPARYPKKLYPDRVVLVCFGGPHDGHDIWYPDQRAVLGSVPVMADGRQLGTYEYESVAAGQFAYYRWTGRPARQDTAADSEAANPWEQQSKWEGDDQC